jgi:hypothetical protein
MVRRRWRVLTAVAAVALFVAAGASWLVSWRQSARIVGTWSDGVADGRESREIFQFQPGGIGRMSLTTADGQVLVAPIRFEWWVAAGQLFVDLGGTPASARLEDHLRYYVARFTGALPPDRCERYWLQSSSAEELQLADYRSGRRLTLTRMPK